MLSLTRGCALAALVMAVAALLAVTPMLATASDPGAVAAKKKCKKKSCKKKAKKKAGTAPKAGTFLTSKNVRVSIALRYPQKDLVVNVMIASLTATCSEGGTHVLGGGVSAPLKGSSFSGRTTYPSGNFAEAKGSFSSPTKASGTVRIGNVPIAGKGICETATVPFTVTKP